jgi:hypothetical protein
LHDSIYFDNNKSELHPLFPPTGGERGLGSEYVCIGGDSQKDQKPKKSRFLIFLYILAGQFSVMETMDIFSGFLYCVKLKVIYDIFNTSILKEESSNNAIRNYANIDNPAFCKYQYIRNITR